MIKTDLYKALDYLADRVADELAARRLHGVAPPPTAHVAVAIYVAEYWLTFAIVADAGLELRFRLTLDRTLDRDAIDMAAERAAKATASAQRSRAAILRSLADTTRVAAGMLDPHGADELPGGFAGVRIAPMPIDAEDTRIRFEIAYHGLTDDLRIAASTTDVDGPEAVRPTLEPIIAQQRIRLANRRRAEAAGGVGLVDGLTLHAIQACAPDPPAFLRNMARFRPPLLTAPFEGRARSQLATWRDGVVDVCLSLTPDMHLGPGYVSVRWSGPQIDPSSLAGSPLSDLAEHPLLPPGLIIERAEWRTYRFDRPGDLFTRALKIFPVDRRRVFDRQGAVVD